MGLHDDPEMTSEKHAKMCRCQKFKEKSFFLQWKMKMRNYSIKFTERGKVNRCVLTRKKEEPITTFSEPIAYALVLPQFDTLIECAKQMHKPENKKNDATFIVATFLVFRSLSCTRSKLR